MRFVRAYMYKEEEEGGGEEEEKREIQCGRSNTGQRKKSRSWAMIN